MADARDVARLLIRLAGQEAEPESMTPMRLQKLLYYCQGWHLAWYGRPLFADRLEAWRHGPVVRSVQDELGGKGAVPLADDGREVGLAAAERAAVERVWSHYRRFSAYGLRDMTHDEPPWRGHYDPDADDRCRSPIPVPDLLAYFGSEYARRTGEEPGSEVEYKAAVAAGGLIPLDQFAKDHGW